MALRIKAIKKVQQYKLKRTLSLFEVTASGVGIILGAGIYALIGVASSYAGNSLWLSFLIAAIIATFTGLSYAELSSIFKGDSTEYEYTRKAFNRKLALVIGIFVVFSGILSASTVAIGFSNYLNALTGLPILLFAMLLIIFLSLINFTGIKLTTKITIVATFLEVFGLLAIIVLGIKYWGSVNLLSFDYGLQGVLKATALVFFAYMGFESIVKLTEETKYPRKNIPKALILSVAITSIIYILTAISAISIMGHEKLSISTAPLAETASVPLGQIAFMVLAIIALFSTLNTVLLSLVTTSRITYGLAKEEAIPKRFGEVHNKTKTPWFSILIIGIISIILLLIRNIETIANAANITIFVTFAFVNASLLILRYKVPSNKIRFRAPLNIKRFSITAFLGMIFSIIMLIYSIINISGI
jgi:APA family basic amino acid/polyamine antiporter